MTEATEAAAEPVRAAQATFSLADRYAFVGATGSGKTYLAVALLWHLMQGASPGWTGVIIDSKGDNTDRALFERWGFVPTALRDLGRTRERLVTVPLRQGRTERESVYQGAQALFRYAYARRRAVLMADEYTSLVRSRTDPGPGLREVFARGRGRGVGLLGLSQEGVYVPRMLFSQADHMFLFRLTFGNDIRWARGMFPEYETPPDPFGFYHRDLSGGPTQWRYWPNGGNLLAELEVPKPGHLATVG
ncbi:MAG: ATP-binding protein [Candidatus Dormibacteria bacterium]